MYIDAKKKVGAIVTVVKYLNEYRISDHLELQTLVLFDLQNERNPVERIDMDSDSCCVSNKHYC